MIECKSSCGHVTNWRGFVICAVDAVIGFTSQTYDVPEDQKAQISIEFIRGEATSPVTVRLVSNIYDLLYLQYHTIFRMLKEITYMTHLWLTHIRLFNLVSSSRVNKVQTRGSFIYTLKGNGPSHFVGRWRHPSNI